MRTYVKAWTVVSTVIVASTFMMSLAATVSAAPGQQGRPDPQAYLVKDIDSTFDTGAGSSPGPFVEVDGVVLFGATYGLWRPTEDAPAPRRCAAPDEYRAFLPAGTGDELVAQEAER